MKIDPSTPSSGLHLAFMGDDFTGSTDALESLTLAGLRTALFLETPTADALAAWDEPLDAIGVAGLTRSLTPVAMEAELRPTFTALRELGARHVHYKVCSTFDSSPRVGSIGRAIEVGREVFDQDWVPVLVGAPNLGRYCVFGTLFASFGIGSSGAVHRLDRHPAITHHPVTPMREADLRRHLADQTLLPSALVDVVELGNGPEAAKLALQARVTDGRVRVVLFDGLTHDHLKTTGALLESEAVQRGRPWFTVGSSAVGTALGAVWSEAGQRKACPPANDPGAVDALLVLSGSCSPVTAQQISWAEQNGFEILSVAPCADAVAAATPAAVAALGAGRSVVVCTGLESASARVSPQELGGALGTLAGEVLRATGGRRVLVTGGDTSSFAGRALGIESLVMQAPLSPGAPLCRAQGSRLPHPQLEVIFKGGQVGAPNFFGVARRGTL